MNSFLFRYTPWALVLLLLVANVTTVISDQVYATANDLVATVVSIGSQVAADKVRSRNSASVKAKVIALETENSELVLKNRALQTEHSEVKKNNVVLTQKHNELQKVVAKRATAVKALAGQTIAILASRSAEAVSTLPLRAAPYVGTAALVGFTTWEIKANCDLAKALANLNTEHGNVSIDPGVVCNTVNSIPSPQLVWKDVKFNSGSALRVTYEALESTANHLGFTLYK